MRLLPDETRNLIALRPSSRRAKISILVFAICSLSSTISPAQMIYGNDSIEGSGGVMRVPSQQPPEAVFSRRPLHDFSTTFALNTVGGTLQIASPLSSRFEIRSGINFLAADMSMNVDGIDCHAHVHSQSVQTTIDWFPIRGDGFHISPGIFRFHNYVEGAAAVGPGQAFTLGGSQYTSSTNDPVTGNGSVGYSRKTAPLLTVGFTDMIPRHGHFSMPIEAGVAFTGPAVVNMKLNGTACQSDGCFGFNQNTDAMNNLNQQVSRINYYLSKVPIYPIFSVGVTYHFYRGKAPIIR